MDSEQVPIFAGQGSSETGKDEQPLYYDKTNHPILVRSSAVRVVVPFHLFARESDSYRHVAPVWRQQVQVWKVPISLIVASVSVHVLVN